MPYSGAPIPDLASCSTRPHTWFYDQVITETGGVAVTLTERVNAFDDAASAAVSASLAIPANGSITVPTRWCSAATGAHSAQSNFSGTDANGHSITVTGPVVQLQGQ